MCQLPVLYADDAQPEEASPPATESRSTIGDVAAGTQAESRAGLDQDVEPTTESRMTMVTPRAALATPASEFFAKRLQRVSDRDKTSWATGEDAAGGSPVGSRLFAARAVTRCPTLTATTRPVSIPGTCVPLKQETAGLADAPVELDIRSWPTGEDMAGTTLVALPIALVVCIRSRTVTATESRTFPHRE